MATLSEFLKRDYEHLGEAWYLDKVWSPTVNWIFFAVSAITQLSRIFKILNMFFFYIRCSFIHFLLLALVSGLCCRSICFIAISCPIYFHICVCARGRVRVHIFVRKFNLFCSHFMTFYMGQKEFGVCYELYTICAQSSTCVWRTFEIHTKRCR